MKRCTTCGEEWTRPLDHNCGQVLISKDRLRTLEECERAVAAESDGNGQPNG